MRKLIAVLLVVLFASSTLALGERPPRHGHKRPETAKPEVKRERPTPEQFKAMLVKRLEEAFVKADKNKDGKLSKEEFVNMTLDRFKAMRERFKKSCGPPKKPEGKKPERRRPSGHRGRHKRPEK